MEEIGIDLKGPEFVHLGCLDEREVRSHGGHERVMILNAFIYLQVAPLETPIIVNEDEVESVHWIPLHFFFVAARNPKRWTKQVFSGT